MVIETMDKNIKAFTEDKVKQEMIARKKADIKSKKEAEERAEKAAKEATDTGVTEVTEAEARQIELEEAAKKSGQAIPTAPAEEDKEEGEEEGKGSKPNAMNGGATDKYAWG